MWVKNPFALPVTVSKRTASIVVMGTDPLTAESSWYSPDALWPMWYRMDSPRCMPSSVTRMSKRGNSPNTWLSRVV